MRKPMIRVRRSETPSSVHKFIITNTIIVIAILALLAIDFYMVAVEVVEHLVFKTMKP